MNQSFLATIMELETVRSTRHQPKCGSVISNKFGSIWYNSSEENEMVYIPMINFGGHLSFRQNCLRTILTQLGLIIFKENDGCHMTATAEMDICTGRQLPKNATT